MNLNKFYLKTNLINLLIACIPLSFIAGNPAINLNLALIILATLIEGKSKIFKINLIFIDKIIIGFFLISIFSLVLNSFENVFLKNDKINMFYFSKTFFFLRYLLLYFCLRYLIEFKKVNLDLFLLLCSLSVIFVSFDLFFQLYFGKDIFGYEITHYKLSGPFGDELIAGSYLQRFSLFLFAFIIIFIQNQKKKFKNLILILSILLIFAAIIIAGNRMPAILFILIIGATIIYLARYNKSLLIVLLLFPLIVFIIANSNERVRNGLMGIYSQIENITYKNIFEPEKFKESNVPEQIYQFKSGVDTWSLNKYFGGSIKSFRFDCWEAQKKINSTWSCDTHPHNYYIEILSDLGLVGLITISILFLSLIFIFLHQLKSVNFKDKEGYIFKAIFLLLFAEFFPIKSTGSFFSTYNATYIFIILPIFVGMYKKNN
jgi:O-antigen ligase